MPSSDNTPATGPESNEGADFVELHGYGMELDPGQPEAPQSEIGGQLALPRLRRNLSTSQVFGLAIAGIVIAALAAFDLLPWWIALAAMAVAMTTLVEGWQRVTRIGALLVAALFLVSIVSSLSQGSAAETVVLAPTVPPADDLVPEAGSLGIFLEDLPDLWNTIDAPPTINRGLVRQNEIGEYDTFVYRFGNETQVAGAFDPTDDEVYALLVSGPLDDAATAQLYLHVCYMVAPFSQDCIDSYFAEGLDGGALEDFTDQVREAEWMLDTQTWRLEIGQNLLAIRVYGEDAA